MNARHALVTGVSSGLGASLAGALLDRGWLVYGLSRRLPPPSLAQQANFRFVACDLARIDQLHSSLPALLGFCRHLDVALLNAGHLGVLGDLAEEAPLELLRTLQVNVVANQALLAELFHLGVGIGQCIAISSGASVNATRGWSGYGVSKAALNMLIALFAQERPDIHFLSLAPGLIDTAMQTYVANEVDLKRFSGMQRLADARGTPAMPPPELVAQRILDALPLLRELPSGSYADLRRLPLN